MQRTIGLIGLIVAMGAGAAYGKECISVTFPEHAEFDGTSLALNGLGLHQATMLKIDAYVAALYVPKATGDANAILDANSPYVLTLQVLRDVGAKDIIKGWNEGFAKNAKAQLPALKDRIAMLNGWMADLKTAQQMTFSFKPGKGVQVKINGAVKGTIEGDDFGKAFLSISLGANSQDRNLKAGLLGGACG